jgi:hypothetical protein
MNDAERWRGLILILLGMLVLGGIGYVIAVRLERWPRLRAVMVRIGDSVISGTIWFLALVLVVTALRSLGWISR